MYAYKIKYYVTCIDNGSHEKNHKIGGCTKGKSPKENANSFCERKSKKINHSPSYNLESPSIHNFSSKSMSTFVYIVHVCNHICT